MKPTLPNWLINIYTFQLNFNIWIWTNVERIYCHCQLCFPLLKFLIICLQYASHDSFSLPRISINWLCFPNVTSCRKYIYYSTLHISYKLTFNLFAACFNKWYISISLSSFRIRFFSLREILFVFLILIVK